MIRYFDSFPRLGSTSDIAALENTIAIFRYSELRGGEPLWCELLHPHKFNFFVIMHKVAGSARVKIDMVDYAIDAHHQCMMRVAPGQILSMEDVSDDFDAYVILMSNEFIESLLVYMGQDVAVNGKWLSAVHLYDDNDKHTMEYIINALRNIIIDDSNPYRRKVLEHMLMVIFYGSHHTRESMHEKKKPRTSADNITLRFLQEVKENFYTERQLGFYAERLCITPRYLSRVVKESTGSSAAEWIERYVVLEAKALLKSTTMTIQQVGDVLNFPSQTFFGKYFKRRVGLSPKEYRRQG